LQKYQPEPQQHQHRRYKMLQASPRSQRRKHWFPSQKTENTMTVAENNVAVAKNTVHSCQKYPPTKAKNTSANPRKKHLPKKQLQKTLITRAKNTQPFGHRI
jgi:hypothetical protein